MMGKLWGNGASGKRNLVLMCKENVIEGGWFVMDLASGSFLPSANMRPRRKTQRKRWKYSREWTFLAGKEPDRMNGVFSNTREGWPEPRGTMISRRVCIPRKQCAKGFEAGVVTPVISRQLLSSVLYPDTNRQGSSGPNVHPASYGKAQHFGFSDFP